MSDISIHRKGLFPVEGENSPNVVSQRQVFKPWDLAARDAFHIGYSAVTHHAVVKRTETTGLMIFAGYSAGGITEAVERLRLEHDLLVLEVARLRESVAELSQQVADDSEPELRELTEGEAKAEIKTYFENHHGETIYASDVASTLSLDYDCVERWLQELERDGQITTTTGATDDTATDARPEQG